MGKTSELIISWTSAPVTGGILSIVSASISILFVLVIFVIEYIRYYLGDLPFPPGSTYFFAFGGLRIVWLLASILAIIGGILAIRRRNWTLSLFGVAASILCVPMVLGIIATGIVAKSKREFAD